MTSATGCTCRPWKRCSSRKAWRFLKAFLVPTLLRRNAYLPAGNDARRHACGAMHSHGGPWERGTTKRTILRVWVPPPNLFGGAESRDSLNTLKRAWGVAPGVFPSSFPRSCVGMHIRLPAMMRGITRAGLCTPTENRGKEGQERSGAICRISGRDRLRRSAILFCVSI